MEGRNGKFLINIISAIYVFRMISYMKYCFFVIQEYYKTKCICSSKMGKSVIFRVENFVTLFKKCGF